MKAFVLLDGTLLPMDRIGADRSFYSGKHKKHGMNVQVIADPFGRLLWASAALPGAVHDVRAAREHGIVDALADAGANCWADKGYQGAGGTVRVPYRGRWETLSTGQQAVNRSHARVRAPSKLSSPSIWPAQTEDRKSSLRPCLDSGPQLPATAIGLEDDVNGLGTAGQNWSYSPT